ncbi:hypothetical protein LTR56_009342 [Elasticomyces elasticus]|nr:hypothetical protein LTR56_009342 [Elasticomyces elasticus]KAK3666344.1 hypothetical protein LTR22_002648 [Elasticomyces elasticus]KAK4917723.1 hypothetical protein LTR49_014400 [Elasticomyces elasticus]KAK5766284.1 hypothetical protein LTS12_003495 [Elasticomyces elasticus]
MTDHNQHQPRQLKCSQALARQDHTVPNKRLHGRCFLDLPGEVRNQIYKFYARSAAVNIEDYQQKWSSNSLADVSEGIATEYSRSHDRDPRRLKTWRAWLAELGERDASGLGRVLVYGGHGLERMDIISRDPARVVISKKVKDGWVEHNDSTQVAVNSITERCKYLGKEEILRIGLLVLLNCEEEAVIDTL